MSPFRGSAVDTKEWRHFRFELDESRVGTIIFNRPDKLNALTFEVYADLRDLLDELPRREDVRALVIAGTGRGFCSGGDVHEIIGKLVEMGPRDLLDFTRMTGTVVQRMRECPLPIVAAVNGIAAGAGAVIALAADFRLLAASASFSFLFTRVGLAGADMGSAYLLPRLVGYGRAAELLMLGERVEAQRALQIGLATAVVDDGALAPKVKELAKRLASGPALAFATTKMLINRELDMDLSGALELEAMAQALLMKSDDHAEFYEAFKAGRDPKWTGR
jgi:enoyl-CoA hydratase/carnithine racemase